MKKLTLLVVFGTSILSTIGYAQINNLSKADSLRNEYKFDLAIQEYASIHFKEPENHKNTYNYASALALTKNVDSAFHYLTIAIKEDSTIKALTDPDLYFLIKDDRWREIENSIIMKVEDKNGKFENIELAKKLWKIFIIDQSALAMYNYYLPKYGENSPLIIALLDYKEMMWKETIATLDEIVLSSGWPKISEVGDQAAAAAWLTVQHSDLITQKRYIPIIQEAFEINEIKNTWFAMFVDKVKYNEGLPLIYGEVIPNEDLVYFIPEIFEPEYVNQRRKEIGLMPIEDYYKMIYNITKLKWTIEQKEK